MNIKKNYETVSPQLKNYRLKKYYYYEYNVNGQLFGKVNNKGWLLRGAIIGFNILIAVGFIAILPTLAHELNHLVNDKFINKVAFLQTLSYIFTPLFNFIIYFLLFLPPLLAILTIIPILLIRTIKNVLFWSILYFFLAIIGFIFLIGLETIVILFLSSQVVLIITSILLGLMVLLIVLPILLYISAYNYQLYLEKVISKEIH